MTLYDFLPYVLPSVKGCPDELAVLHLRLAVIDFCERAQVIVESLEPIEAEADVVEYLLPLPVEMQVAQVLELWVGPTEWDVLLPAAARRIARRNTGGDFAWCPSRDRLRLSHPVAAGTLFEVDAALTPTIDAEEVPDDLARHSMTIAHGALARLMRVPGQDWTNQALAADEQTLFEQEASVEAIRATRGHSRAKVKVRAHFS